MGGLTVLAALRRALPHESFVYLGDTARLPYGTKSPATVQKYAQQAARVLVERGVKALVVACNTASGLALEHLERCFAGLPVFGVVEPGAQAAAAVLDASGVLVLATESTVQGGAYQRALLSRRPGARVFARACPLWVTLAEQGPVDTELERTVLAHAVRGMAAGGPTTVLLGCTHFPVFEAALERLFAAQRGPGQVRIVDSAATTASAVACELERRGLDAPPGAGTTTLLATDGAARFRRVGGYFLGEPVTGCEIVDI